MLFLEPTPDNMHTLKEIPQSPFTTTTITSQRLLWVYKQFHQLFYIFYFLFKK